jgi:hypothetical protein
MVLLCSTRSDNDLVMVLMGAGEKSGAFPDDGLLSKVDVFDCVCCDDNNVRSRVFEGWKEPRVVGWLVGTRNGLLCPR